MIRRPEKPVPVVEWLKQTKKKKNIYFPKIKVQKLCLKLKKNY